MDALCRLQDDTDKSFDGTTLNKRISLEKSRTRQIVALSDRGDETRRLEKSLLMKMRKNSAEECCIESIREATKMITKHSRTQRRIMLDMLLFKQINLLKILLLSSMFISIALNDHIICEELLDILEQGQSSNLEEKRSDVSATYDPLKGKLIV